MQLIAETLQPLEVHCALSVHHQQTSPWRVRTRPLRWPLFLAKENTSVDWLVEKLVLLSHIDDRRDQRKSADDQLGCVSNPRFSSTTQKKLVGEQAEKKLVNVVSSIIVVINFRRAKSKRTPSDLCRIKLEGIGSSSVTSNSPNRLDYRVEIEIGRPPSVWWQSCAPRMELKENGNWQQSIVTLGDASRSLDFHESFCYRKTISIEVIQHRDEYHLCRHSRWKYSWW